MKRKTKSTPGATKPKTARQIEVQQALQLTWELKGRLKSIQMYYLRIGAMLVTVREEKMFATLGHATIEEYAEKRLQLGRTSLYRYIKVYDWVKASHPEWLEKHPKGFIPEFSDTVSLIWIEKELKRADLSKNDREELENLDKKGLAGELRQSELAEWRKKGKKVDTLQAYLNKFRSFRTRCARIAGMPAEIIRCLDDAIDILKNHQQVAKCGFDMMDADQNQKFV